MGVASSALGPLMGPVIDCVSTRTRRMVSCAPSSTLHWARGTLVSRCSTRLAAGLIAGYFGGRTDDVLMRLADIQLAFPFILLAIAVIGVLGPSLRNIIVVIGVSSWVVYARVVRAAVFSLREREFVQAAQALGGRDGRVVLRHILPNALTPWLVVATLDMARGTIVKSARPRRRRAGPQESKGAPGFAARSSSWLWARSSSRGRCSPPGSRPAGSCSCRASIRRRWTHTTIRRRRRPTSS